MKKLLKPIFDAVAKPGIIGPHNGYECALLLAGAKPLSVFWECNDNKDDIKKLDQAVAEGRLIKGRFSRPIKETYYFYTLPGKEQEAEQLQKSVLRNWWDTQVTKAQELETIKRCENFKLYSPFRYGTDNVDLEQAVSELTERTRSCVSIMCPFAKNIMTPAIKAKLEKALEAGTITCTKKEINACEDHFIIYGQPDQEQNMKELALTMEASYFRNDLPEKYNCFYEGKLLGFTENDLERWRSSYTGKNFIQEYILRNTNNLRRWCRVQSMLIGSPHSPEI